MFKSKLNSEMTADVLKGRIWIGLVILADWLVIFWWSWISFPFVGHKSNLQNITYGVIVGIPFLAAILIYLALSIKDLMAASRLTDTSSITAEKRRV
jgi:hypothetical protein